MNARTATSPAKGSAQGAAEAIAKITEIIAEINYVSNTIASATEEQSATTNEISRAEPGGTVQGRRRRRAIGPAQGAAGAEAGDVQTGGRNRPFALGTETADQGPAEMTNTFWV
jgi:hypothetical protein